MRTSYLPDEIIWGHRLAQLDVTYRKSNGKYCEIDCANFHCTVPVADMPPCSASDFATATLRQSTRRGPQSQDEPRQHAETTAACSSSALGDGTKESSIQIERRQSSSIERQPTTRSFNVSPVKCDAYNAATAAAAVVAGCDPQMADDFSI